MDFEKFTDRSKGFIQAAQTIALRQNHQQVTPEHLLKALLDDKEGLAANLLRSAGADPVKALEAINAAVDKLPKVEGAQMYVAQELGRVLDQATQAAEKAGDSYVTAEYMLLALATSGTQAGRVLKDAGVSGRQAEPRHQGDASRPDRPIRQCRGPVRRTQEVCA